jgi:hypothetical protein
MISAPFTVYEPSNQWIKLSPDTIIYSLAAIGFIAALVPLTFDPLLQEIYILSLLLVMVYFGVRKFYNYEPLYGVLDGDLVFRLDAIIVKGYRFELRDVATIEISLRDFYGKINPKGRSFNANKSQGVNNYLQLTDLSDNTYLAYFQLSNPEHYKSLEPLLDEYHRQGKMTFAAKYELQRTELFT